MALPSTLHQFEIELADVDRSTYETLSFRLVKHPSETTEYALVRVLAYALEYRDGLSFGKGLCVAEEPALSVMGPHGNTELWLDIGAPSADRLHKASKLADAVVVYTHKPLEHLWKEWSSRRIHDAERIRVVEVPRDALAALEPTFGRSNSWSITRSDGLAYISVGDVACTTALPEHGTAAPVEG